MVEPIFEDKQMRLFEIDDQFIYVFQSILTSGILSKITPNGLVIHMIMKTYAFRSGSRYGMVDISKARLSAMTGCTPGVVRGVLRNLLDNKYLEIVAEGGKTSTNLYRVNDLLPYKSKDSSIKGILVAPYRPFELREQRQEIQRFARTGKLSNDSNITNIIIKGDMHFHIHIGDNTIDAVREGGIEFDPDRLRNSIGDFVLNKVLSAGQDE